MRWICLRCSAEYDERPPVCGACLQGDRLAPVPARVAGREVAIAPRRRVGLVRAGEMRPDHRPAPYGPPWDRWRFGEPHALELKGPPGGGKSTLATKLAVSAARRVPVLYIAAEEGHSSSLAERLERAELDELAGRRLAISDARSLAEVEEDLRQSDAAIVIVDSVTEMAVAPPQLVPMLLGRSWIVIVHLNGRGESFGGNAWAGAADASIRVEDGLATPAKNRFGPMDELEVYARERS